MTNDFNNAFNALTSVGLGDDLSSDPALYSQVSDSSHQDNLHHSGILDFNQNHGVDPFPVSNFEGADIFHNPQPDYSLPDSANPHYQQTDHYQSTGYADGQHEHHSLSFANQLQVMNCSSHSDNCPSITITNLGMVYKQTPDSSYSDYVGMINGRSVYNSSHYYLGYAGTDGKVYDNHNDCVGWVDGCHVYNKGGVEVYDTTQGVVGAAAYLLCVYYGGVN